MNALSALRLMSLSLIAVLACSQQEEGERCDPANHSTDCDSGLRCVPLSELHRGTEGAVCCPATNATADVCLQVDFSADEGELAPTSVIPTSTAHLPSTPLSDAAAPNASSGPDAGMSSQAQSGEAGAGQPDAASATSTGSRPDAASVDASTVER